MKANVEAGSEVLSAVVDVDPDDAGASVSVKDDGISEVVSGSSDVVDATVEDCSEVVGSKIVSAVVDVDPDDAEA